MTIVHVTRLREVAGEDASLCACGVKPFLFEVALVLELEATLHGDDTVVVVADDLHGITVLGEVVLVQRG